MEINDADSPKYRTIGFLYEISVPMKCYYDGARKCPMIHPE